MTVLDHKLLAQHRAGRVLALDARAIGSSVVLHATRPSARSALAQPATSTTAAEPISVAVVDIIGPLAQRGESQLCGFVDGYDWIGERLGAALEEADAVVLRIDSPGGDVAGLAEAVRRMRAAVEAAGKPVVAYVDELAASAAYWIAAGVADEIVIPPMGSVGSIGSFGVLVDITKSLELEGTAVTLVRDPEGKCEAHPAAPITDLARERLGSEVQAATARFVDAIATRRELSANVLRALNGAVLHGADAVRAGLADRVGTLEDVIRGASAPRERAQMSTKTKSTKAEDVPAEKPAPEPAASDPVPVEDGMVTCPGCGLEFQVAMPSAAPPAEEAQALAALVSATKATSPLAALATIALERGELAELRAYADRRRRADIGAELVRAGALPSEVWADPSKASDPEQRQVSALYAAMPIEDLRAMPAKQGKPAAFAKHTPIASIGAAGLSAFEIELCKAHGITPEKYAETRATMAR